jgi:hypothetical protein
MELRYRGNIYQKPDTKVKIVTSNLTARFLGQTYSLHTPVTEIKPNLGLKKYRGITYGK